MIKTVERKYLTSVLLLYFSLTLLYSLGVPLWEAPDEPSHYLCIRRLSDGRGFKAPRPSGTAGGVWTPRYLYSLYQCSQPPLYYLVATPVMGVLAARFLPLGDQIGYPPVRPEFQWRGGNLFIHERTSIWKMCSSEVRGHLLRLFSVLLGGITVYLIYRMAQAIFPSQPLLALAAAGFSACLPQFNFVSGSINNDGLAILMSTATLLYLVKLVKPEKEAQGKDFINLGALLGLSLLTKYNLLFLFPLSILAVILKARDNGRGGLGLRDLVISLLPAALLTTTVAILFPELARMRVRALLCRLLEIHAPLFTFQHFQSMVFNLYRSFWAVFGWMSIPVGGWLYLLWGLMVVGSLGGWFRIYKLGLLRSGAERRSLGLLTAGFLILLLGVVKNNLLVRQSQGRFILPTLGPFSLLLSLGLLNLFPEKCWRGAVFALLLVLVGLNLAAFWIYLLPASYP